ncbi:MAG: DEAD/DEAH box helicase, partial [Vicinamibacterales bacterium]|nr:DEAD/DEAH box helicase [Vicinamibacterales bacterium]
MLLHPFDRVVPDSATRRTAAVSRRVFWRSLASRTLTLRGYDTLLAPAAAAIDILPYQLEPVIAAALHHAPRVLLADGVGLGKTIQAGLITAELFARGEAARVLVLVPPALRDQWAAELRGRFDIEADVIDAGAIRALGAGAPGTVNPWGIPRVAIVSIDFAKRPEVCAAIADAAWDVVIVDEAHTVTLDTDRHRATHQIARHASRVILLTATPHSGDASQFAALIALGAATPTEPIVMFRRSRSDVGISVARRSRLLRVRVSRAESGALALVLAYVREVWAAAARRGDADARLVATVLLKRALSAPASLARSVERRRAL